MDAEGHGGAAFAAERIEGPIGVADEGEAAGAVAQNGDALGGAVGSVEDALGLFEKTAHADAYRRGEGAFETWREFLR